MVRRTISVRLSLDGGKAIEQQLRELGERGEKAFRDIQAAADKLKGPGAAFARSVDQLRRSAKEVGDAWDAAGRKIRDVGKTLSVAITAPVVGAGAVVLHTAADFEAGMNRVRAALGSAGGEFTALRDKAKELGRTTQFSATEAADAIETLAKNGLDAGQILGGALTATLGLAAATGSDLSSAADVATDAMLSFGKGADDLDRVVDQMTGTMLTSKLGFQDYAQALGQAGGVAGGLGVSFEDFNAALAGTSNLFSGGSDAGTSFKNFLTRLNPQSKEAAELMRKLGLSFFEGGQQVTEFGERFHRVGEVKGQMKSLADIAELLRKRLSGLSERDRANVLTEIFGTDAMRTAIGLMKLGAEGVDRLAASIDKASAAEQAKARMEGFSGSMKELRSAVEGLSIAIAESGLLQWATDLVKATTEWVQGLARTNPELLKWGTIVAGIAAVVGPALVVLGQMVIGFAFLAKGFSILLGLAAPLLGMFTGLGGAVAAVVAAIVSLGPLLAGLVGTVASAIAGIIGTVAATIAAFATGAIVAVALAALAALVYVYWDEIVAAVSAGAAALAEIAAGAWDSIAAGAAAAWQAVAGAAVAAWDGIGAAIAAGAQSIAGSFLAAWDAAGQALSAAAGFMLDEVAGLGDGIASVFERVADYLSGGWLGTIRDAIEDVVGWARGALDTLRSLLSAARDAAGFSGGGSVGGGAPGFAGGGRVSGPGTSTSDSILAWLSTTEFVMQAKAVRHYGVDFMAALNAMKLPRLPELIAALEGGRLRIPGPFPRFAGGGPVAFPALTQRLVVPVPQLAAIPAFAGGGPVAAGAGGQMATVNLTIGGETFAGLMAPRDVADRLVRFALGAEVASAGRRPGWLRG